VNVQICIKTSRIVHERLENEVVNEKFDSSYFIDSHPLSFTFCTNQVQKFLIGLERH
jgi:hypothetical protein